MDKWEDNLLRPVQCHPQNSLWNLSIGLWLPQTKRMQLWTISTPGSCKTMGPNECKLWTIQHLVAAKLWDSSGEVFLRIEATYGEVRLEVLVNLLDMWKAACTGNIYSHKTVFLITVSVHIWSYMCLSACFNHFFVDNLEFGHWTLTFSFSFSPFFFLLPFSLPFSPFFFGGRGGGVGLEWLNGELLHLFSDIIDSVYSSRSPDITFIFQ